MFAFWREEVGGGERGKGRKGEVVKIYLRSLALRIKLSMRICVLDHHDCLLRLSQPRPSNGIIKLTLFSRVAAMLEGMGLLARRFCFAAEGPKKNYPKM